MHEIDYKIFGDDMQYVEIELDPNEATVAEAGGMMYMDDGIEMETVFGDGSQQQGGFLGALVGAGKRLLTGESLFMTVFLNRSAQRRKVAFGAPYPGKIIAVRLADVGGELIAQKDSFLAAAKGVSVGIAFQRKLGAGLFGGEGFIMQRLQDDGWAFVHAGGTLHERTLQQDELVRVDTGRPQELSHLREPEPFVGCAHGPHWSAADSLALRVVFTDSGQSRCHGGYEEISMTITRLILLVMAVAVIVIVFRALRGSGR